ncbi:MAG: c-type cytochrome [Planctomycetaceae bacterium]|nr:c-type cytochrome [Planctomycetaceae bacterium]
MLRFRCCLLVGLLASSVTLHAEVYEQVPVIADSVSDSPDSGKPAVNPLSSLLRQGPKAKWIWGADNNTPYTLTKTFATDAKQGRLIATCDNQMTLFLNGKQIAASTAWETPVDVDISRHLQEGQNTLTAQVKNAGGIAAFACKLVLSSQGDKPGYVVSDEAWMAVAGEQEPVKVSKRGTMGDSPWGNVFAQQNESRIPPNTFLTQPGFQVEELFTVPKEELGSWVCIALDDKGRILASDQGGKGLYRITPGAIGSKEPTKVEPLDVKMTSCQGMLHAFGSLYCSVNGGPGSGLYRLTDTTGDDQYDKVEKLKDFRGGGEHGPHALRLSPDGKSIYVIAGNHTDPPFKSGEDVDNPDLSSRIPTNWGEDLLLPRQWDARGHARGKLAPGGWIAKTDPDGKTWEIVSIGYRNPYDMDFNADGELFAYDADMEWDMGSPWYRPTRVVHATSGSEFGWRSGTGKWPTYYPDTLPPVVNIGPGSPVGVSFGYGTQFPARYQQALYLCDWTFGTMYAIHLTPDGSSYTGVKEEFLSRSPLPLTDVLIGQDGAMYFTVGGRNTQSALFRVTYVGDAPTAPVDARDTKYADARQLRRRIEKSHQAKQTPTELPFSFLLGALSEDDRFTRYAALIALTQAPADQLTEKVLFDELDVDRWILGSLAAARHPENPIAQKTLLKVLQQISFPSLDARQQIDYLRALSLVFIRLGEPSDQQKQAILEKLDGQYPTKSENVNRELVKLLVYLDSPTVVAKAMDIMREEAINEPPDYGELLSRNRGYGGTVRQMLDNHPDLRQYHLAFVLRNATEGWSNEDLIDYFDWFNRARTWSGGASYQGFLENISNEAYANINEKQRLAVEVAGVRKPFTVPELPKPEGPGRKWSLGDLLSLKGKLKGRDFEHGRKMFAATRCVICHRFAGEGGATGPDLTQLAGRFNLKDLSEAIVEPSKVISDQYLASSVVTEDGDVYNGRIVNETESSITILTDPEDSTKVVEIPKKEIEEMQPSKVSIMPADLLKPLNEEEVLDLLAYLLSRGDKGHLMFRK